MPKKSKSKLTDKTSYIWAILRITLGLIMLWAFADKMFGLGNTTCLTVDPKTKAESVVIMCPKATIKGGSATTGFLKFAAKGPMKTTYNKIAGNKIVDYTFMAGLLLIGLSLVSGIGIKIGTVSAMVMFLMMWTAVLPPENHPFLDDHIVYLFVMLGILLSNDRQVWGLGQWWQAKPIVKKYPLLA